MCHKYKTHPLFCFKEYNYPKLLSVPALGTLIVICWVIKPQSSANTDDTQQNSMPDTQKKEAPKRHFPMDWMSYIIICLATSYSVYAVL